MLAMMLPAVLAVLLLPAMLAAVMLAAVSAGQVPSRPAGRPVP
jgi:hypothetical protein